MGSEQNRFPQQERRKKWGGCWGGLSCFGSQKGRKRIVPASRTPDSNTSANPSNGSQAVGITNQATSVVPSLLAPPSSPASFTNSALPSTAQSPNCFLSLSANSPGGPPSTMFATGPYAHETQPVSPPFFSSFTTEPSTASLTPPPELAHLTTPSSPDVPFAEFLSSSLDHRCPNGIRTTYPPSPGSPASSLISPVSRASGDCLSSSFHEKEFPLQWDPSVKPQTATYPMNGSGQLTATASVSQDSNFFCPATFAQFYLDQPFPHSGGRLSISRESDVCANSGSAHQSRQNRTSKQEVEEIEAYRASFGFSADEMITTPQYVEISDVTDESFTIMPQTSNKLQIEESILCDWGKDGQKERKLVASSPAQNSTQSVSANIDKEISYEMMILSNKIEGHELQRQPLPGYVSAQHVPGSGILTDEEVFLPKMKTSRIKRKHQMGLSCSDAEIDYRRGRSLRECREDFAWHE
ncbi:hypothetical protein Ancab_031242 [Ancistrocladus abbreviatus]